VPRSSSGQGFREIMIVVAGALAGIVLGQILVYLLINN
jgi:hypothetical protein